MNELLSLNKASAKHNARAVLPTPLSPENKKTPLGLSISVKPNSQRLTAETKEFMALYIGKETSESFKKQYKKYKLTHVKSKKNLFVGTIQKIN